MSNMKDFEGYISVQELIDELQKVEDKNQPVAVFCIDELTGDTFDAGRIGSIDDTMDGLRIDLNTYVQF